MVRTWRHRGADARTASGPPTTPCGRYNGCVKAVRKIVALVAVVAAYAVLFVVVCPSTPTPVAVLRTAGAAPVAVGALLPSLVLLMPSLLLWAAVRTALLNPRLDPVPTPPLVELTCARLC